MTNPATIEATPTPPPPIETSAAGPPSEPPPAEKPKWWKSWVEMLKGKSGTKPHEVIEEIAISLVQDNLEKNPAHLDQQSQVHKKEIGPTTASEGDEKESPEQVDKFPEDFSRLSNTIKEINNPGLWADTSSTAREKLIATLLDSSSVIDQGLSNEQYFIQTLEALTHLSSAVSKDERIVNLLDRAIANNLDSITSFFRNAATYEEIQGCFLAVASMVRRFNQLEHPLGGSKSMVLVLEENFVKISDGVSQRTSNMNIPSHATHDLLILQTLMDYGTATNQAACEVIKKEFVEKECGTPRDNVTNRLGLARKIHRNTQGFFSDGSKELLTDIFNRYGHDAQELFGAWWASIQGSSEYEIRERIDENIGTMLRLEQERPGITDELAHGCSRIQTFARFDEQMLINIYDKRNDLSTPFGWMVCASADDQGVFYNSKSSWKGMGEQVENNIRIIAAGSKSALRQSFQQLEKRYGKGAWGYFASHGLEDRLILAADADDPDGWITIAQFDGTDGEPGLLEFFHDKSPITLESCLCGEKLASQISQKTGGDVIADPYVAFGTPDLTVGLYDQIPQFHLNSHRHGYQVYRETTE